MKILFKLVLSGLFALCGLSLVACFSHEHNYVNTTVIKPTCIEQGYTIYYCDCGYSKQDDYVNALGHSEIIDVYTAPSCSDSGFTEGSHCSICSEIIIEQEEILPLGHTLVGDKCSVCQKTSTSNLKYELNYEEDGYSVVGCFSQETDIIIPLMYNDLPVTEIGFEAFSDTDYLTTVTLNSNIETVGFGAFSGCNNLKKIVFASSVKNISYGAFNGCESLLEVDLPTYLESIGHHAFSDTAIKEINIPRYVSNIGDRVFEGCENLKNIFVHSQNSNFSDIDGVLMSGNNTILYCYPAGKEEKIYDVPNSVKQISRCAFMLNNILTEINLSNVEIIGDEAFNFCFSLEKVDFGGMVKEIGTESFSFCGKLNQVNLPKTLQVIKSSAFDYCGNVESYNVDAENSYFQSIDGILYSKDLKKLVAYPGACENEEYILPDSTIEIGDNVFSGQDYLKKIILSNNISSIGQYSLPDSYSFVYNEYMNGLYVGSGANPYICLVSVKNKSASSFIIHSDCRIIYSGAFYGCSNLKELTVHENIREIGIRQFWDCVSLEKINFNSNDCRLLTDMTGSMVDDIFDNVGTACPGVIVEFGSNVKIIPNNLFAGDDCNIKTVIFNGKVDKIGGRAFYGCDTIEKVYYNGLIDDWVGIDFEDMYANPLFYAKHLYNNGEEVVELNLSNATVINAYSLYNAVSIEKIEIGTTTSRIEQNAFSGCSGLKELVIGANVKLIDSYAFRGCTSLEKVNFQDISDWYVTTNRDYALSQNGGMSVDVTDINRNCENLSSNYNWYIWYKK